MTSIFSIQNVPHHHHHNSFHNYQHHSQAQPQFVPVQQQQAPAIHIPLQDERHILAERFKTKMCRNFLTQGFCPYESRCMFAHGDAEMRTAEMNIRDGLFTEEAIKAFKRAHRMVERAEAAAMLPPPPAYTDAIERDANNAPMLVNSNAAPDYFQQPQYTHSSQMENESFEQDLYPDTPASRNQEEFVEEGGEYQDDCESLSGAVEHQDGLNGIHNEGNSNSSSVNSRTAVPLYRHNPYSLATPFEVMPVKTVSGMMNAHVMP